MHQMFHQQHCSRWETAMTNWHSWALRSAALLLAGCGLLSARIYAQEQKATAPKSPSAAKRSEEHTSELQSPCNLVCRLLLEKKKKNNGNRELNRSISF